MFGALLRKLASLALTSSAKSGLASWLACWGPAVTHLLMMPLLVTGLVGAADGLSDLGSSCASFSIVRSSRHRSWWLVLY